MRCEFPPRAGTLTPKVLLTSFVKRSLGTSEALSMTYGPNLESGGRSERAGRNGEQKQDTGTSHRAQRARSRAMGGTGCRGGWWSLRHLPSWEGNRQRGRSRLPKGPGGSRAMAGYRHGTEEGRRRRWLREGPAAPTVERLESQIEWVRFQGVGRGPFQPSEVPHDGRCSKLQFWAIEVQHARLEIRQFGEQERSLGKDTTPTGREQEELTARFPGRACRVKGAVGPTGPTAPASPSGGTRAPPNDGSSTCGPRFRPLWGRSEPAE
jgi:hypothetical protein